MYPFVQVVDRKAAYMGHTASFDEARTPSAANVAAAEADHEVRSHPDPSPRDAETAAAAVVECAAVCDAAEGEAETIALEVAANLLLCLKLLIARAEVDRIIILVVLAESEL